MLKVFHAYPTYGLPDEDIKYNVRKEQYTFMPLLTMEFDVSPAEIELADVNMKDTSMFGLGSQIVRMSKCDVVILGHDWENDRACRLIKDVAESYGSRIIDLDSKNI